MKFRFGSSTNDLVIDIVIAGIIVLLGIGDLLRRFLQSLVA